MKNKSCGENQNKKESQQGIRRASKMRAFLFGRIEPGPRIAPQAPCCALYITRTIAVINYPKGPRLWLEKW